MLPFTMPELSEAVADRRVTARRHPSLPYTIYNYSPDVQYSNKWDEVTLTCRGLILDDEGNVVARSWRKFFNLGQVNLPIQFTDPVEVMDKADGSLGILYPTPWGSDIATRGSFTSYQAEHATDLLRRKYPAIADTQFPDFTYLFEIIYPANRIVLDYGDTDDLMMLGAVENKTGYYFGPRESAAMLGWTGPVVEVFPYKSISEALGHMNRSNAEGYVIRSHNFMVKVKEPDYIELHKLVTNASPKTVWDKLRSGMSRDEVIAAFPDEFHDYIASMTDPLLERYNERLEEILDGYASVMDSFMSDGVPFDRGAFARSIAKAADKRYYFLLLDNKSIGDVLWAELKPRETKEAG